MSDTYTQRRNICQDTLNRAEGIIAAHEAQGATISSEFIAQQLPPLAPRPDGASLQISVVNSDSFTAAREIPESEGKTAVLNLASDLYPAGGWVETLSKTQEEALCYSSTLYATLKPSYYPWPNTGEGSVAGVYSPGVVVFKHDLDHGCVDLPEDERRVFGVITVAAPRGPRLTPDGLQFKKPSVLEDLRGKIRLVYRMAAHKGNENLILGAMGCGAYFCPPRCVAVEMKSILLEDEFKGHFRKAVFAVYSTPRNGGNNFQIFKEVMEWPGPAQVQPLSVFSLINVLLAGAVSTFRYLRFGEVTLNESVSVT